VSDEQPPKPGGEPAAVAPADPPAGPPAVAAAAAESPAEPAAVERVAVPEGIESVLPEDAPRITLPLFEGPLDLLLYLIKREKIDIHDIPIAPITRQYMEYLDLMRELNLDVAGEFMVMAATLIHIKSKMLVPIEPTEVQGEEEYVDPREELVQRLLEFQRYKEAAGILHQQAQIRAAQFTRPDTLMPRFDDAGEEMLEAGLYDLVSAFKELLDRRKALLAHEVEAEGPPVEQRMEELLAMIREGESLEFLELFASLQTKAEMIVTFLALLELVRLKHVRVYQRGMFGGIRVFRPVGPPAEAAAAPTA
jgi:segregation and condensation protein A